MGSPAADDQAIEVREVHVVLRERRDARVDVAFVIEEERPRFARATRPGDELAGEQHRHATRVDLQQVIRRERPHRCVGAIGHHEAATRVGARALAVELELPRGGSPDRHGVAAVEPRHVIIFDRRAGLSARRATGRASVVVREHVFRRRVHRIERVDRL